MRAKTTTAKLYESTARIIRREAHKRRISVQAYLDEIVMVGLKRRGIEIGDGR